MFPDDWLSGHVCCVCEIPLLRERTLQIITLAWWAGDSGVLRPRAAGGRRLGGEFFNSRREGGETLDMFFSLLLYKLNVMPYKEQGI